MERETHLGGNLSHVGSRSRLPHRSFGRAEDLLNGLVACVALLPRMVLEVSSGLGKGIGMVGLQVIWIFRYAHCVKGVLGLRRIYRTSPCRQC
jgi:hypothetical protein